MSNCFVNKIYCHSMSFFGNNDSAYFFIFILNVWYYQSTRSEKYLPNLKKNEIMKPQQFKGNDKYTKCVSYIR